MDSQFERRLAAVRRLVEAVFARFVADEGKPRFGSVPDNQRWWRHSQDYFMPRRRYAWLMPNDLPIHGWLDRFPEMAEVRAAFAEDGLLGLRVDESLGTTFARQGSNFYWILAQHVIEPMVVTTSSYHVDETVFDRVSDLWKIH